MKKMVDNYLAGVFYNFKYGKDHYLKFNDKWYIKVIVENRLVQWHRLVNHATVLGLENLLENGLEEVIY